MNTRQQQGIERFRRYLERKVKEDYASAPFNITKFEVTPTAYGDFWISADLERTTLPEGNLLRALDHEHWFVRIGKRGGLTARIAPQAYKQFNGRRAFGMLFMGV